MKKLIISLAVILTVGTAHANSPYSGKLDILSLPSPSPFGGREVKYGNWVAGFEEPLWHLQIKNSAGVHEVFHVSYYQAWLANNGFPAYGVVGGINTYGAGETVSLIAAKIAPDFDLNLPPIVPKLANLISIEGGAGYRPVCPDNTGHWVYVIGGQFKVPFSLNSN